MTTFWVALGINAPLVVGIVYHTAWTVRADLRERRGESP